MQVGALEIKLFADLARLQADMNKANRTVDQAMGGIEKTVGRAKAAFTGLAGAVSLGSVIKLADDYKRFDAQIRLSTRSNEEYARSYADVIRIGRIAQSDIGAVGKLYSRLNSTLHDTGVEQSSIAKITETVALALRVNNSSVQETNSVMLQLSQSFASGRLNGQEFLALSEGSYPLMKRLADSMQVPIGALKDLSAQGKITRNELVKAFGDDTFLASLRAQVKEVGTVSGAVTVLVNNLKQYIGEADKATSATSILQKTIILLADNINVLVTLGLIAGAVAFGKFVTGVQASIAAQRTAIATTIADREAKITLLNAELLLAQENYKAATAIQANTLALANNAAATTFASREAAALALAERNLAAATAGASVAARGLSTAIAFLGGPIGIAITGVILFGDKILDWINKARGMTPELVKIREEMERLAKLRNAGVTDSSDPQAGQKVEIKAMQDEIARLTKVRDDALAEAKMIEKGGQGFGLSSATAMAKAVQAASDLSVEYIRLRDALAQVAPQNKVVGDSFGQLTSDLKTYTKALAEFNAQKALIEAAGVREGKSRAEIDENLKSLYDKLVKPFDNRAQRDAKKDAREQLESIRKVAEYERKMQDMTNDAWRLGGEIINRNDKRRMDAAEKYADYERKMLDMTNDADRKVYELQIKRSEELAKKRARDNDQMAERLSRSMTDALFRAFESGKSFAQAFKEVLINSLKTLAVQPFIENVIKSTGIADYFSKIAAFADNKTNPDGTSKAGSVFSSVKGLYNMVSSDLAGVFVKAGSWIQSVSEIGSVLNKFGTTIITNAPMLGSIGTFLGAVGTAYTIASALGLFGGHVSRPKYYANTAVTASGVSTISAYGNSDAGGSKVAVDAGASLGKMILDYTKALNGEVVKQFTLGSTFQKKYNLFAISVGKDIAKNGVGADFQFNVSDTTSTKGAGAAAFFYAVKKGFINLTGYVEDLIKRTSIDITKAYGNLTNLNKIMGMYKQLSALPAVFDAVRTTIEKFSTLSNSSMKTLQARFDATATFVDLFYTDVEKQTIRSNQLQLQFAALNLATPADSAAFRALVENASKATTKAGLELYDALVAIAPAFDTYLKGLQAQKEKLDALANSLDKARFRSSADYVTAQAYTRAGIDANEVQLGTADIITELRNMHAALTGIATHTYKTATINKKWDIDGTPEVRV